MEKVQEYARMRNPNIKIFPIAVKIGVEMDVWLK